MNKTTLIALVVIVIAVGAFLLMRPKASKMATDTSSTNTVVGTTETSSINGTSPTSAVSTTTSGTTVGTTKEFTVEADNFEFETKQISVNKGDTVKRTFKNTGGTHDWVVDEFNARTKVIQGDTSDTVTFVADKTGSFEYYCSVGNHRQMGMKGTLTVS